MLALALFTSDVDGLGLGTTRHLSLGENDAVARMNLRRLRTTGARKTVHGQIGASAVHHLPRMPVAHDLELRCLLDDTALRTAADSRYPDER
jgi:hypothetical protein